MIRQFRWSLWIWVWAMMLAHWTAYAEQTLSVNNTRVNLRSGPTAGTHNIITTVPQGTSVLVISQQGAWYQVRLPDGQQGWISNRVLSRQARPSSARQSQPAIEAPRQGGIPATPVSITSTLIPDDSTMIFISGGMALLGSSETDIEAVLAGGEASRDMLLDEVPQRTVSIQGFYIDAYEVTNAQYKEFVDATDYPAPLNWENRVYLVGTDQYPVTFVSWDDAQAYAQWAGKRLPTAEEWEVAARGLHGKIYPWGNAFDGQSPNVNTRQGVAAVGSHPNDVSEYGVHDMGGNVTEWTMTSYGDTQDFFVLKGSSWVGKRFEARAANKTPGEAVYQLSHIGFRCARSK